MSPANGVAMTTRQRFVLTMFETINARESLDEWVQRRWPHDVYRQTVAVMGHDPLAKPVVPTDDAANVMPR